MARDEANESGRVLVAGLPRGRCETPSFASPASRRVCPGQCPPVGLFRLRGAIRCAYPASRGRVSTIGPALLACCRRHRPWRARVLGGLVTGAAGSGVYCGAFECRLGGERSHPPGCASGSDCCSWRRHGGGPPGRPRARKARARSGRQRAIHGGACARVSVSRACSRWRGATAHRPSVAARSPR